MGNSKSNIIVDIESYWKKKKKELEDYSKSNETLFTVDENDVSIIIKKMVLSDFLDIPISDINYYLNRDSWLRDFVGDYNNNEVNVNNSQKFSYINKKDIILSEVFYEKDRKTIIKNIDSKKIDTSKFKSNDKNTVKNIIKALIEEDVFTSLKPEEKKLISLFEKIYFEPIELFNDCLKDETSNDNYYLLLIEQWKTANEMAANISAQRNSMNNFYVSLVTALVGGIIFSNQFLSNTNPITRIVLYIIIIVAIWIICNNWIQQIENYCRLNGVKYEIINEIEKKLPVRVMYIEYIKSEQNANRKKRKKNFSTLEKKLAKKLRVIATIVLGSMCIFTLFFYWEDICNTIMKMIQGLPFMK